MEGAKQLHTESALADLYEHIHKMPESTQKRKLIKKIDRVRVPTETTTPPPLHGARVGTTRGIDAVVGRSKNSMGSREIRLVYI